MALQTGSAVVVGVSGAAVALLALLVAWRATEPDPGLTTEVALVLAFALGVLAQRAPALAFAAALAGSALLAFRARLHGLARKLFTDRELQNALVLGVAALLVLPVLPDRPVDPFGAISPFDVWKLVVVVMAVGAAGALAQRLVRPRVGLTVAGLASGFVSSAATVAGMGRLASSEPRLLAAAVSGATASSVATFVQLALLIAASGTVLLRSLAFALGAGGLTALGVAAVFARRVAKVEAPAIRSGAAFRLVDAVVFAAPGDADLLHRRGGAAPVRERRHPGHRPAQRLRRRARVRRVRRCPRRSLGCRGSRPRGSPFSSPPRAMP